MRIALPADVGAYLHRDNDQTLHAHTDNTLNCDHSHAQSLVFAESSETNSVTSELDKASTNNLNEITAHVTEPQHSTIFFAKCIFEPVFSLVHGDFAQTQASSNGLWPMNMRPSGKGPYGSIGIDNKDETRPFQCIDEDEFLMGVHKGLHSISL
ncbi:hypothetical protein A1F96_10886 [Pyrenophora tritici-repentis]|nr:hypothetical protein A1F96_10886 [Pyrenophora tritici-repentis]